MKTIMKNSTKNEGKISEMKSRKLYSMQELADFLGCSTVTAQTIKNSGKIPYYQIGRKCIFDTDKVLAALEHGTKKNKK